MIKVVRVYDLGKNEHVLSIVADEKGFSYVFPKGYEMFDSRKRAKRLIEKFVKDKKNTSVDDMLSIAKIGLGRFVYDDPREERSLVLSTKEEQVALDKELNKVKEDSNSSPLLVNSEEDMFQVLSDYPELYEQLASDDPEQKITADGMNELVFAALGEVDPNGPNGWLVDALDGKDTTDQAGVVFESTNTEGLTAAAGDACPPATQDISLNLKNRQNAIDNVGYGPLNPEEPNDKFWQAKADRWRVTVDEAKTSRCGNCAAFIKTSRMLECIAQGLQQGDENVADSYDVVAAGDLGYCEALDFKCASSRTCDAWIAGGPVTDETGKEQ